MKVDPDGGVKEDWFQGTGDDGRWPSSTSLTGMGMVDGQLQPLRNNADDTIEQVFASPDPTITSFLVGQVAAGIIWLR